MPSIYIVKYIPFEDNNLGYPWQYSGSDMKDSQSYLGSVQQKNIFKFTDGLQLRDWWKIETKTNPQNFKKIIIATYFCVTQKGLRQIESQLQTKENHAGDLRFFNFTNHNWNCDNTIPNKYKGIPLEKQVGIKEQIRIRAKRSEQMKEVRKDKNWSTKGCADSRIISQKVSSHWQSLQPEEKTSRAKKSRFTRIKKLKESGDFVPNKKWIYVIPGQVITWQTDEEILAETSMSRAKIKQRCKNNTSIITEKQIKSDPFLYKIENCLGKQFKEIGFYRIQIEEWRRNEIQ